MNDVRRCLENQRSSGRLSACGKADPWVDLPSGSLGGADGCNLSGGGSVPDAAFVIYRLEEAGRTLLALPAGGYSTRLRSGGLDYVRDAAESYGWSDGRIRPAVPPAARITRMDEALAWVSLLASDKVVLRRIVGCRALVSPVTERHLFSWRRLAGVVGADHKAVQRWHAQGIDLIVVALARAGGGKADVGGRTTSGR